MDSNSLQNSFFQEFLDICVQQLNKDENKKKIQTYIVEPSFTYIFDRFYPYIILTAIIFILLLLLSIIVLFIFIKNHQQLLKS
jgi:hypothetical protein